MTFDAFVILVCQQFEVVAQPNFKRIVAHFQQKLFDLKITNLISYASEKKSLQLFSLLFSGNNLQFFNVLVYVSQPFRQRLGIPFSLIPCC